MSDSSISASPVSPLFSVGLRPFFLGGALWAAMAMILWLAALSGHVDLPTTLDPVSWHSHAFLFGYLGASISGFLLTAVPNWTGRPPLQGGALIGLFVLWGAGRLLVLTSSWWPVALVAGVDLAVGVAIAGLVTREICIARNWRNLVIVAMLLVMIVGNAVFHAEAARGDYPAQGYGVRIALAAAVLMIAVIGGRILPVFTRNWMTQRAMVELPPAPMQRFDVIALAALLIALVAWVLHPDAVWVAFLLVLSGLLHLVRLWRWKGHRTLAEPLVTILHIAYAFIPLGALLVGLGTLTHISTAAAAQHLWMAGGIGVMTLAVMTRASLGHTGRSLTAGRAINFIYLCILISVFSRVLAGIWFEYTEMLQYLSGISWILAFAGFFAAFAGPLTTSSRETGSKV